MLVGRRVIWLVVGIAVLASLIYAVMRAPGFDDAVHQWLLRHRHGWTTSVALAATNAGSSPVLYSGLAVAAAAVWWRQRRASLGRRLGPVIALGVLVCGALVRTGLSDFLHRNRPPRADWLSTATGWSMPSGHSANAALAAQMVLWSIWRYLPTRSSRLWSVTVAILFAGAVGWSRAYLGVHWPTDVLAGWLFATCFAGMALWIIGRIPGLDPTLAPRVR